MNNEVKSTDPQQKREHLYSAFLKETTAVLTESFMGDITERGLARLIQSLWKLKHGFQIYSLDEVQDLILYLTSQRKTQDPEKKLPIAAYTIFLSKANGLLTEAFTKEHTAQRCLELAKILIGMKKNFEKHFEKAGANLDTLYLPIGMAESVSKSPALKIVLESFSTQYQPQKIVTEKVTAFVKPSSLPKLHFYKVRNFNGLAASYRFGYYLIGEKRLPPEYQYHLIDEKPTLI